MSTSAPAAGAGPWKRNGSIRLLTTPRRFIRLVVSWPTKQPFLKSIPFSRSKLASASAIIVDQRGERHIFNHRGDALAHAKLPDDSVFEGCDAVLADPSLVGQTLQFPIFASGRIDGYLKGRVTMESAARDANISPAQLQVVDAMAAVGLIEKRLNWGFLTRPDASELRPEAAGLGVAVDGALEPGGGVGSADVDFTHVGEIEQADCGAGDGSGVPQVATRVTGRTALAQPFGAQLAWGWGADVVAVGAGQQPHQIGGFTGVELAGGLAEIELGGLLEPLAAEAQEGAVEIELEDLILVEARLQLPRHRQFADLARQHAPTGRIAVGIGLRRAHPGPARTLRPLARPSQ